MKSKLWGDTGDRADVVRDVIAEIIDQEGLPVGIGGVPLISYATAETYPKAYCPLVIFTDENNRTAVPDAVIVKMADAMTKYTQIFGSPDSCVALKTDFSKFKEGTIRWSNLRKPENGGSCAPERLANYVMRLHAEHEEKCGIKKHNPNKLVWNPETLSDGSVPESELYSSEISQKLLNSENPNLYLSGWHRVFLQKTLRANSLDVDIVLFDKPTMEPLVLIESKSLSSKKFYFRGSLTATIANQLSVPAYFVRENGRDQFWVEGQRTSWELEEPKDYDQFKTFILGVLDSATEKKGAEHDAAK